MRRFFFLISLTFLMSACGTTADYSGPIGKFQKSVGGMSEALKPYFLEINKIERGEAYDALRATPDMKVEDTDDYTFLNPTFDVKGLNLRLEALKLIELYALRLAQVAGSKVDTSFQDETQALGKNLVSLSNTLGKEGLGSYVTPIADLVAAVGAMWINKQRERILGEAISKAGPKINDYISLLEADLVGFQAEKVTILVMRFDHKMQAYNAAIDECKEDQKKCMSAGARIKLANEMEALANRIDSEMALPVTDVLNKLRQANAALIKFANDLKEKKKNPDFSTFVSNLETYAIQVQLLTSTVKRLKEAG